MLPAVWQLERHGQVVDNVEGLCRAVLNRAASRLQQPLEDADYQESLAFLLGEVVVITEERWPPRRDRYPSLGAYLSIALPTALVDHWRSVYGRNGMKRVLPADALEQAARDRGADDSGGAISEPIDERWDARVEEAACEVGLLIARRRATAGVF